MPSTLEAIKSERQGKSSAVSFVLKGAPAVHTFREDSSFAVDIGHDGAAAKSAAKQPAEPARAAAAPVLAITPPDTVPAADAAGSDRPAAIAGLPPLIDVPAPAAKPAAAAPAAPKAPVAAAKPLRPLQAGIPMLMPALAGKEKARQSRQSLPCRPQPRTKRKSRRKRHPRARASSRHPIPPRRSSSACSQGSDALRLEFPFALPTPAAAFIRADMLWLVFDTQAKIDVTALKTRGAEAIRSAALTHGADGEAILRIHLKRPQLVSLDSDGPAWTVAIGDVVAVPPHPLGIARSVVGRNRANIVIPFEHASGRARDRRSRHRRPAHRRYRARTGARLRAPARLCRIQPARFRPGRGGAADRRRCRRSAVPPTRSRSAGPAAWRCRPPRSARRMRRPACAAMPFDTQIWGFDRKTDFEHRQAELIRAAAGAPPGRACGRGSIWRASISRASMSAEAKACSTWRSPTSGAADVTGSVLGAVADRDAQPARRGAQGARPAAGRQPERRADCGARMAYARQGQMGEARDGFRMSKARSRRCRSSCSAWRCRRRCARRSRSRDYDRRLAASLNDFESIGVPRDARAPRSRCWPGGWPKGWAAPRTRSPPTASPRPPTDRPAARAGPAAARSRCATRSARSEQGRRSPRWKR